MRERVKSQYSIVSAQSSSREKCPELEIVCCIGHIMDAVLNG